MSIDLFKPEMWSARLLRHLLHTLVYAQATCVNRNWEGEISQKGDTVHIQKVGRPAIVDYVKGTPMTPESPDGTTIPLVIDRDKGFYLNMDDLDQVQVNVPLFDEFAKAAAEEMALVIDQDVAARQVAGAGIVLGEADDPIAVGNGVSDDFTVFEMTVEIGRLMNNNKTPREDRWMVIPPDLEAAILLDPNFIAAGSDAQRTGQIGRCNNFDILTTTAVPVTPGAGSDPDTYGVVAGAGNYATTFASQFVKTEAERLQGLFEDALKGRNAWGSKVVESETLAVAHVEKKTS